MNVLVVCDWNMNLVHIDSIFTGNSQDNTMYMSSSMNSLALPASNHERSGRLIHSG